MVILTSALINGKNVLKVDWISSRQANDELLQANRYLRESDFRLQLFQLKEKKHPNTLHQFLLWDK